MLPSHLVTATLLPISAKNATLLLIEPYDLFTSCKFHKKRLLFFLESLRTYRDYQQQQGYELLYEEITSRNQPKLQETVTKMMQRLVASHLESFAIEERSLHKEIFSLCQQKKWSYSVYQNPLFLSSKQDYEANFAKKKVLRLRPFYEKMRQQHNLLMDGDKPKGGKWSFDQENRKPLGKQVVVPKRMAAKPSRHRNDLEKLIAKSFATHPGDTKGFWLPTSRESALTWLEDFLDNYFI